MSKSRIGGSVAEGEPRSIPEVGSGDLPGEGVSPSVVKHYIDSFYEMVRGAVDTWGGPIALASQLDTAMSGVSDRLHRREVKGALQRAFLDYAAIACTHPVAAEQFLFGLCDLFGFEHPKRKRTKTTEELFGALVKRLRSAGELGEAAIARAARDLGADVSEFDR